MPVIPLVVFLVDHEKLLVRPALHLASVVALKPLNKQCCPLRSCPLAASSVAAKLTWPWITAMSLPTDFLEMPIVMTALLKFLFRFLDTIFLNLRRFGDEVQVERRLLKTFFHYR